MRDGNVIVEPGIKADAEALYISREPIKEAISFGKYPNDDGEVIPERAFIDMHRVAFVTKMCKAMFQK